MCVGLSDVGTVIKNRFLNFISKLQAQHYSTILMICWICAFVNCDWKSYCDWCSDFFLCYVSFSVGLVLLDGNSY